MDYLFHNEASYQKRRFLTVSAIKDKTDIIFEVGSLNEFDKREQYQVNKEEILDLINVLTRFIEGYSLSSHKFSSNIQEAEIVP